MAKQSLFSACKRVFRDGISGTYTVGNNDIFLELYSQQDIDQNNEIGNSSEENIVVVAGDTITIPEGYTLTPVKPKKSLVVICNTFVNNGTVSMYQKAPNVLPHDFYIIGKQDGILSEIVIPAYTGNQVPSTEVNNNNCRTLMAVGIDGNDGTNRQCGSGGVGNMGYINAGAIQTFGAFNLGASGSGYAFGGGAGTGGGFTRSTISIMPSVDSVYPMRGGNGAELTYNTIMSGGVGNPVGVSYFGQTISQDYTNNVGCGGRIIVFCNSFTNNGEITVNGTDSLILPTNRIKETYCSFGGASGAGAIDIFYTNLINEGTTTANGGISFTYKKGDNANYTSGKGGNGSITLTPWAKSSVLKPIAKYMSKANMIYFLTNYIERLKQGED